MDKIKKTMNANIGFIIGTSLAATSFLECMTLRVLLIQFFIGWFMYNLAKTVLPEKPERRKQARNGAKPAYHRNMRVSRGHLRRKPIHGKIRRAEASRLKPGRTIRKFKPTA